jgi:MEDS: MEthanogen/methylotroph, DcmR Sensory domain
VKEGFEQKDKIFQIVDGRHLDERRQRLGTLGIDVAAADQSGQIEVRSWANAHLRGGRFDQYAMLDLVEDFPGCDDIVEYESRLNRVTSRFDDVVICTYDLNRFSATVVMDILRTHPQVIVGGLLQENPFYVPPEELLEELRARSASIQ